MRWKTLHQSIYVIAVAGVLHYLWLVKADVRSPIIYDLILWVSWLTALGQGGQRRCP